ncbi:MAG: arsenate reductase ArsC [Alphaproteobacteria bacterium]|nr:arsenate reductase ArsC [Alphaproteobacteria bacterium]
MKDAPYTVLFLCTGNSARSIMAEAIVNADPRGAFHAVSAGSKPRGAVDAQVIEFLRTHNFPVETLRSKGWEEFSAPGAPALDFVFTVCDKAAQEPCPVWPGQPMSAHWGVPDPAGFEGTPAERAAFLADVFRMLNNRISVFTELPIESLDRLTLQRRLDEIGRASAPA